MALSLHLAVSMIRMTLQLTPPLKALDKVMSAFRLLTARTRVRPGCLECRLTQNAKKATSISFEEDWNSWEELERYICSDAYLQILQLMELSTTVPVLHFEGAGRTCGMEFVQVLRKNRTAS